MDLQGINVLIDGYNLELSKGTGIKTYGISLIKALTYLGANVDILCSRSTNTKNSILSEVLFFDFPVINSKLLLAKNMLFAASQQFYEAKKIPNSDFVIKYNTDLIVFDYLLKSGEIFSSNECFTIANYLYKLLQIGTKIKIDKKIDIWHTTYPLPIKINNAKKITTIHDLIPLKLPYTTLDNKTFFFKNIQKSIQDSTAIITISETTKKDILDCFDINPDKIHVTYQPIIDNALIVADSKDEIYKYLNKYQIRYKKYILFVGTIEPKKNVGRLIDAYSGLDTDMQLVIVGKKGWLWEEEIGKLKTIFNKRFTRKIKLLEFVSNTDLLYLYKGAFCFVFPSLYEGFGLPPLEAMSLECPVITSNVASLPEICGDAALYVDPYDTVDIRSGIETLINNPDLRTQLSIAGKERVKLFSIENYVKKLYEVYAKVL